jgi:hypothetical protein
VVVVGGYLYLEPGWRESESGVHLLLEGCQLVDMVVVRVELHREIPRMSRNIS